MADDTLTLALNGDVTIADYSLAIQHFHRLIVALHDEVSHGATIEWIVHDLQVSSAIATLRGRSEQLEQVTKVRRAYISVGHGLEENRPIPFRESVRREALALADVLGERIPSMRFEIADEDVTIVSPRLPKRLGPETFQAYGAVVGRIQTVSNRQGLRFTLYDSLYDRAVSCYLEEGQEEVLRDLWGSRAIVHGWLSRDALSGRPVVIRRVSRIDPLPDRPDRYSYLSARGVVPRQPGEPLPEDIVRRIRDAW